jgi:hypothetical protein
MTRYHWHRDIQIITAPSWTMSGYGMYQSFGYTARFRVAGRPVQFVSSHLGESAAVVKAVAAIDMALGRADHE